MSRAKLVVAVVALVSQSLGCREAPQGEAPRPRFVVVTHGQAADPFWSVVKRGVDQAAFDVKADVSYRAPSSFNMVDMARLLDAAVASKPDGIAVSIPDAQALSGPLSRAKAAGIAVISLNSGAAAKAKLGIPVHVGQDELEAGRRAGARMRAGGVKTALCVNHEVGNVALDRRCEGFKKGLSGAVEVLSVDLDPTATQGRVLAALQANQGVQAILALGPIAAMPSLKAIRASGRTVQLATFDLSSAVLSAIEEGAIEFALDQQPYLQGYLPIVLLSQLHRTGALPASDILTGPGFITRDLVESVTAKTKAGVR